MEHDHRILHPVLGAVSKAPYLFDNPLRATSPSPPWLSPADLVEIAHWCAARILRPVTPQQQALLDEARAGRHEREDVRYALGNTRYPTEGTSVALLVRDAALRADRNPAAAVVAVKAAARITAQLTRKAGGSVERLARALDEELLRREAIALIRDHVPDGPAIGERVSSVLFRAEADRKGRLGHCIVRLANGHYGLMAKLKGRYRWFEGERAEVLATVPDPVFSEAVDVVVAREAAEGPA